MPDPGSITRWIGDLREGRDEAVDALWRPYYERLIGLAPQKLGGVSRRVADEIAKRRQVTNTTNNGWRISDRATGKCHQPDCISGMDGG